MYSLLLLIVIAASGTASFLALNALGDLGLQPGGDSQTNKCRSRAALVVVGMLSPLATLLGWGIHVCCQSGVACRDPLDRIRRVCLSFFSRSEKAKEVKEACCSRWLLTLCLVVLDGVVHGAALSAYMLFVAIRERWFVELALGSVPLVLLFLGVSAAAVYADWRNSAFPCCAADGCITARGEAAGGSSGNGARQVALCFGRCACRCEPRRVIRFWARLLAAAMQVAGVLLVALDEARGEAGPLSLEAVLALVFMHGATALLLEPAHAYGVTWLVPWGECVSKTLPCCSSTSTDVLLFDEDGEHMPKGQLYVSGVHRYDMDVKLRRPVENPSGMTRGVAAVIRSAVVAITVVVASAQLWGTSPFGLDPDEDVVCTSKPWHFAFSPEVWDPAEGLLWPILVQVACGTVFYSACVEAMKAQLHGLLALAYVAFLSASLSLATLRWPIVARVVLGPGVPMWLPDASFQTESPSTRLGLLLLVAAMFVIAAVFIRERGVAQGLEWRYLRLPWFDSVSVFSFVIMNVKGSRAFLHACGSSGDDDDAAGGRGVSAEPRGGLPAATSPSGQGPAPSPRVAAPGLSGRECRSTLSAGSSRPGGHDAAAWPATQGGPLPTPRRGTGKAAADQAARYRKRVKLITARAHRALTARSEEVVDRGHIFAVGCLANESALEMQATVDSFLRLAHEQDRLARCGFRQLDGTVRCDGLDVDLVFDNALDRPFRGTAAAEASDAGEGGRVDPRFRTVPRQGVQDFLRVLRKRYGVFFPGVALGDPVVRLTEYGRVLEWDLVPHETIELARCRYRPSKPLRQPNGRALSEDEVVQLLRRMVGSRLRVHLKDNSLCHQGKRPNQILAYSLLLAEHARDSNPVAPALGARAPPTSPSEHARPASSMGHSAATSAASAATAAAAAAAAALAASLAADDSSSCGSLPGRQWASRAGQPESPRKPAAWWMPPPLESCFLLCIDADTQYDASGVQRLRSRLERDSTLSGVCGLVEPVWSLSPLIMAQYVEYLASHMLGKSFEMLTVGSVSCLPGCFSMWRLAELERILPAYSEEVSDAMSFLCFAMGEDRFLCSLALRRGARLGYAPEALARTHAPAGTTEFVFQRARWHASTIANFFYIVEHPEAFPWWVRLYAYWSLFSYFVTIAGVLLVKASLLMAIASMPYVPAALLVSVPSLIILTVQLWHGMERAAFASGLERPTPRLLWRSVFRCGRRSWRQAVGCACPWCCLAPAPEGDEDVDHAAGEGASTYCCCASVPQRAKSESAEAKRRVEQQRQAMNKQHKALEAQLVAYASYASAVLNIVLVFLLLSDFDHMGSQRTDGKGFLQYISEPALVVAAGSAYILMTLLRSLNIFALIMEDFSFLGLTPLMFLYVPLFQIANTDIVSWGVRADAKTAADVDGVDAGRMLRDDVLVFTAKGVRAQVSIQSDDVADAMVQALALGSAATGDPLALNAADPAAAEGGGAVEQDGRTVLYPRDGPRRGFLAALQPWDRLERVRLVFDRVLWPAAHPDVLRKWYQDRTATPAALAEANEALERRQAETSASLLAYKQRMMWTLIFWLLAMAIASVAAMELPEDLGPYRLNAVTWALLLIFVVQMLVSLFAMVFFWAQGQRIIASEQDASAAIRSAEARQMETAGTPRPSPRNRQGVAQPCAGEMSRLALAASVSGDAHPWPPVVITGRASSQPGSPVGPGAPGSPRAPHGASGSASPRRPRSRLLHEASALAPAPASRTALGRAAGPGASAAGLLGRRELPGAEAGGTGAAAGGGEAAGSSTGTAGGAAGATTSAAAGSCDQTELTTDDFMLGGSRASEGAGMPPHD